MTFPNKEELVADGFVSAGTVKGIKNDFEIMVRSIIAYPDQFHYHVLQPNGVSVYREAQLGSVFEQRILNACVETIFSR